MSLLYTARIHAIGGRDGTVKSDDGKLDLRLSYPKALGGDGAHANTEQLFAAGYASCFASTLKTIAKAETVTVAEVEVDAEAAIHLDAGAYDLQVHLWMRASEVERAVLTQLVEKTKGACPYSRATRGNVRTTVELS